MNTKLLRKVKKHILDEPRRLDMDSVLVTGLNTDDPKNPPCGTVACVAGWALVLSNDYPLYGLLPRAAELLEIKNDDAASRLFNEPRLWESFSTNRRWPKKFADRYNKAKTAKERAKVTAERIEHFIKTRGKE